MASVEVEGRCRRGAAGDHAERAQAVDRGIVEAGVAQHRVVVLAHARRGALRQLDAARLERERIVRVSDEADRTVIEEWGI